MKVKYLFSFKLYNWIKYFFSEWNLDFFYIVKML